MGDDTAAGLRASEPCFPGQRPTVSPDSIGPLVLSAALHDLRALCESSRDTMVPGENSFYPAVAFPFDGLVAIGSQYRDTLDETQPADAWRIEGFGGYLPGGVPLDAPWATLSARFGRAVGNTANGFTVRFCNLPKVYIQLTGEVEPIGPITDFKIIPPDARIRSIFVIREGLAGWAC